MIELSRVEDVGLNASATPSQRLIDGWLVRSSPGKAKRSRCVNAIAAGRLALEHRMALAAEVYADAGLPLIVRITPFSAPGDLDSALAARGLRRFDETHVLVGDLERMELDHPLPAGTKLQAAAADDFARIIGGLRGSPEPQQHAHAARLAASPVPYRGWLLCDDDAVLACGQTAREGTWVGLYDVHTRVSERGRGLSLALCAAMLRHSRDLGACHAYLQVDSGNAPALAVYRRLGFEPGYDYHYRAADPASA